MACKCSDCPEVACRLNRLHTAAQDNTESAQHIHQHTHDEICREIVESILDFLYEKQFLECETGHEVSTTLLSIVYGKLHHA